MVGGAEDLNFRGAGRYGFGHPCHPYPVSGALSGASAKMNYTIGRPRDAAPGDSKPLMAMRLRRAAARVPGDRFALAAGDGSTLAADRRDRGRGGPLPRARSAADQPGAW